MTDETILTDADEFADEGVRLHPRARTDHHALLYFRERSNKAVVADLAAVDIARHDDLYPLAEIGRCRECVTRILSLGIQRDVTFVAPRGAVSRTRSVMW